MRDIADLLEDAELAVYVNGVPVISKSKDEDKRINAAKEEIKRKKPKPPFKFHMAGINVGDEIVFDALNLPVKVASDDEIEYKGRLWSLSTFTTEFLPETRQSPSRSYQGPKYFSYKGITLSELRKKKRKNKLEILNISTLSRVLLKYFYGMVCECVYGLCRRFVLCRVNLSCEWLEWLYKDCVRSERYLCDVGCGMKVYGS